MKKERIFSDPCETPEEVISLICNFGNRPDIRAVQTRQIKEIKDLINNIVSKYEDALLACHRYFTAQDQNNNSDEKLCRKTAVYLTNKVLDMEEKDKFLPVKLEETEDLSLECPESGDMSPEEIAAYFNEKKPLPVKKFEVPKTLEGIEAWEKAQDNSNDIYKVAARVKNLARENGRNLTGLGEMLANTYVHVLKSFYDFAEKLPSPHKEELIALVRSKEGMPGDFISAIDNKVKVKDNRAEK